MSEYTKYRKKKLLEGVIMTEPFFGNDHNPLSSMNTKPSVSEDANDIERIENIAVV